MPPTVFGVLPARVHLPLDPARHVLEQSDDRLLRVLRLLKLVRLSLVEPIDELLDTNKPPAKSRAPMLIGAYGLNRRCNGQIQNSPRKASRSAC